MKTPNKLQLAVFITLFSSSLLSCSKDALTKPDDATIQKIDVNKTNRGGTIVQEYGSLQMIVLPVDASASAVIYNEEFSTNELLPDKRGIISFEKLKAGNYIVSIHPYNSEYTDLKIEGVVISAEKNTDLGEIILENNVNPDK